MNGFWSGVFATGPMTFTLFRAFRALPLRQRSSLPPALITFDLLRKVGLSARTARGPLPNLTMLTHLGYGGMAGSLFALISDKVKAKALTKGIGFGLIVWGVSYLGWLPALNFRARATNMTPARNGMMVLAHIAWGAALGLLDADLEKRGGTMLNGKMRG